MGCSVHTGRSAPAKTGGRPHFAQNGHFGDAVRSVGRGRSGAPVRATVGGTGDVDPLAALRGAQGGASYIIRGARVASMTRKRTKSCRFGLT